MSITTASIVKSKLEQATQLTAEVAALSKELKETREKLGIAQRTLRVLQDKRQQFAEEAARGRTPKPGEITALSVAIDEATIPFDGLTSAVNSKQAAHDQVRARLETLEYEISIETQREAQRNRFDALEQQGREVAAEIGEILRVLIGEKLPAFDAVRDSLAREFPSTLPNMQPNGDELAHSARALLVGFNQQFFDGPFLRAERKLLREGWQVREDLVFTVKNLRPPR